jgi:broad specificity phosphatase PhoE
MHSALIFLRHAETKKDETLLDEQWTITDAGKKSAEKMADTGVFDDVDVIISSNMKRAYQTAEPFAARLGEKIIRVPEFNEISRRKAKMINKKDYEAIKARMFVDLDFAPGGWETARSALSRFKKASEKMDMKYENKKILIVTHGTVMSLFFASLQNKMYMLHTRWGNLDLLGHGIVKDNKVIKDIV